MNKMSVIQSHLGMRFSTFVLFLDKKCNHMVRVFFNWLIYVLGFFSST